LKKKEACDSLLDSNKALFRNFSASKYQLNLLILIVPICIKLAKIDQGQRLKIVDCAFFKLYLAVFGVFLVLKVYFWLFLFLFFEIFIIQHTEHVILYKTD
jgi:hypothetical protein